MSTMSIVTTVLSFLALLILIFLKIAVKNKIAANTEQYAYMAQSGFQKGYEDGYRDTSSNRKDGI